MSFSFEFASPTKVPRRSGLRWSLAFRAYHAARLDAVVVALTTGSQGPYFGDCPIVDWSSAGLLGPTKAKGVIETLERSVFEKKIGVLSDRDFQDVQASIRQILGL